jgi:hypothetical protein
VENSLAQESDLKPRGEMVKELSRLIGMEVDRMNTSQGSRVAVGLNQGSRFKDYLRGFLDPYEKDLKLRGWR